MEILRKSASSDFFGFFEKINVKYRSPELYEETAVIWRDRLQDISWFMRCLNESIARQANREDGVKGHFWEGRFKSQALLDEQALLSCMMYVDLNPIRAGLAKTPESSEFTSIHERIQAMSVSKKRGRPRKDSSLSVEGNKDQGAVVGNKEVVENTEKTDKNNDELFSAELTAPLCLFSDQTDMVDYSQTIPFAYRDYLELLDWTSRAIRADKRGAIPSELQPILTRLGVEDGVGWVDSVRQFNCRFAGYAGSSDRLQQMSQQLGLCWVKGQAA